MKQKHTPLLWYSNVTKFEVLVDKDLHKLELRIKIKTVASFDFCRNQ